MKLHPSKLTSVLLMTTLLSGHGTAFAASPAVNPPTATPIKHVVVIYGENISFDHYFGIYPKATNPTGEPAFTGASNTPTVDGLTPALLTNNPNLNPANGTGATNPFRLDRAQAVTADQNHAYGPEEAAFDADNMDLFPKNTGTAGTGGAGAFGTKGLVMGYYDGNTVTGLWNYAQHFALNDASYSSQFGPSTPGAVNLISGQTNGAVGHVPSNGLSTTTLNNLVADGQGGFTMYGDSDPFGDVCSSATAATTTLTTKNIGDLLNVKGISWGWFEGGFDLSLTNANGTAGCKRSSTSITLNNAYTADYIPHHQPFQYYATTRNLGHKRPPSVTVIGTSSDGAANHQYDSHDFFDALKVQNLPAVSFLKAPAFQDGHAGYSDPIDEQGFEVSVINAIAKSQFWSSTVVIIAYDDSDGWYDHATHVINPSTSAQDALFGAGKCGPVADQASLVPGTPPADALLGVNGKPVNGRCGYGTRQPLLVISPYARPNFVDHTVTDQSSILRFIEDNWLSGERIGQGSYDAVAGTLNNMFDFNQTPNSPLILDAFKGTVTN